MRSIFTLAAVAAFLAAPAFAAQVCEDGRCCTNGICTFETEPTPTPDPDRRWGYFEVRPSCGFLVDAAGPVIGRGLNARSGIQITTGNPLLTLPCGGWGVTDLNANELQPGEPFLAVNRGVKHWDGTVSGLPLTFTLDPPNAAKRLGKVDNINLWLAGGDAGAGKAVLVRAWNASGKQLASRKVTLQRHWQSVAFDAPNAARFSIATATQPYPQVVAVARVFVDRVP